ncbi:hypothetical protein SMAC4_07616 [Sordaria macrospora]|nr:hypothetical protein SMAC4_07616 [Sordaria macrospora]
MSRTSQTLTNTDLAFLLCTLAATSQSPKASISFVTDYGLVLSLEPDSSISISLRKPTESESSKQSSNPFDSTTPIKSQQLFAFSPSIPGAEFHNGSIDGVLFSPVSLLGVGMGGASITPARSISSPMLTRTSSQSQSQSQRNMPTNSNTNTNSNSPKMKMKIKYYIRPGLEVNSSSHMYYTASPSTATQDQPHPHSQPQPQPQPAANMNIKQQKLRLHRVKLSHLQSLYHHAPSTFSSNSRSSSRPNSNSWFDSYLDWIDRLEDALTHQASQALSRSQQQQQQQQPQTPTTALPLSPIPLGGVQGQRNDGSRNEEGPFTDSGEKSLWLVEGLLLASWLSLQEGVEGVEYLPLCSISSGSEGDMGVYRLEQFLHEGMEDERVAMEDLDVERKGNGKPGNNAGEMMGRLLEIIRGAAGDGDGAEE